MLMLKVFGLVQERSVKKRDGTEFTIRFQEAEIHRPDRRPRAVEIPVNHDDGYDEGFYTLSGNSFRTDQYDRIQLAYPELISVAEAIQAAETVKKAAKR